MDKIFNHEQRQVGEKVQERINALGIGQKMQDLPEELWHESFRHYVKHDPNRKGGPNLRMIRLNPDKPSLTVTGYIFNKFVHPYDNRYITPREAARLQGFPDDIEFMGTLGEVQRQIGDAVPIELGTAIMNHVLGLAKETFPNRQQFLALSLFSGAGGLDIASQNAKSDTYCWKTLAAVEIESSRCATLKSYFEDDLKIYEQDIRELKPQRILDDCGITHQDITLVYGGPPCQSFSQAGKQKGINDDRGELIFEFLRFIETLRPPFFMMENVPNLKGIDRGQLLQAILNDVSRIGYDYKWQILNASHFGSAQKRKRLIILGAHNQLNAKIRMPEPTHGDNDMFLLPVKTVAQAFVGLPSPI